MEALGAILRHGAALPAARHGALADVAPGHSSSVPVIAIIFLVIVAIAVALIVVGVVLAVRRRGRHRNAP